MAPLAPRPFSTLGVKPFLFLTPEAQIELQAHYIQLSRKHHPDRMHGLSNEARERAESLSAQINADFAILKDRIKLVEAVLANSAGEASVLSNSDARKAPPELAMDYFELQEAVAESGSDSVAAQKQLADFMAKVNAKRLDYESRIEEFSKRFPYSGLGDGLVPWHLEDLSQLAAWNDQLRYYRSFERDIQIRFASPTL